MTYKKIALTEPRFRHLLLIEDATPELYVEGAPEGIRLLERLPRQGFAVVGTRQPLQRSVLLTKKIISELDGTSLIIVSGLARGIDTAAHWAALQSGIPTVAVLGCGHGYDYPRENQELRKRILESGGLIISEFPPETRPYRSNFIRRNRWIAGLSQAVWIVEAPFRSGALSTSAWAKRMGILRFVTPTFPGQIRYSGNERVLKEEGAFPLIDVESLQVAWPEFSYWKRWKRIQEKLRNQDLVPAPSRSLPLRAREILDKVREETLAQNGVTSLELIDWALRENWRLEDLFLSLEVFTSEGLLREENGHLLASQL